MEKVAFYVASLLGTFRRPKLTNVTTGIFTGQSMVFHTQEGEKYVESNREMVREPVFHEYHRNNVNKNSVNLRCSYRNEPRLCKASLTVVPSEQQLEDVIKLCHYIGGLNEKNVIGQFESQFQSDIADLDDTDELVFDENELI